MKWYTYVICFILIVCGAFCSVQLVKLFNVSSKEYGTAITIETKNDYNEFVKFDYGSVSFDTEDYIHYVNVSTFANMDFNGNEKDYILLFNGQPLNNLVKSNGRISATLNLEFYDLQGEVCSTANVDFCVEFYARETKVTISMINSNNSVSYFNSYLEINGAVLKIVERGV